VVITLNSVIEAHLLLGGTSTQKEIGDLTLRQQMQALGLALSKIDACV
jgi:hypothetical protein